MAANEGFAPVCPKIRTMSKADHCRLPPADLHRPSSFSEIVLFSFFPLRLKFSAAAPISTTDVYVRAAADSPGRSLQPRWLSPATELAVSLQRPH